jgi:hypothetical protein
VALGILMLGPSVPQAQEVTGGMLGRVQTTGGEPVAGAIVTATSASLLGERTTTTNARGEYRFILLPVGEYDVEIRFIGYRAVRLRGIYVQLGKNENVQLVQMEPVPVQLEAVVVSADETTIDPTSTALAHHIDAATLAILPTERDYQQALAILPQANRSYYGDAVNIGGSTGSENMLFIDGVNVTEANGHTRGLRLPYNFIQSVQVKEGGYEAQYGRALGGIANAVTHTGSNTFEASLFGFYSNDGLAATPVVSDESTALPVTGFATYDFGARVSGPIVRNRLWFSAAYNPYFERQDKSIAGLGTFRDTRTEHRYAGKLTWLATNTSRVELTVLGDPATHSQVRNPRQPGFSLANADPVLYHAPSQSNFGSLRWLQDIGSRAVLDVSLGYSRTHAESRAATARGASEAEYWDFDTGTISDGVILETDDTWRRLAVSAKGTVFLGPHEVTLGAEYEDNSIDVMGDGQLITFFTDPVDGPIWITNTQQWNGTVGNRIPTLFVQDAWRATAQLTIHAGLRWSEQRLIGNSDTVAQVLGNELQPRLGVSYLIGEGGRHKVFAGYGRYYQQDPLANPALWYLPYTQVFHLYFTDPRTPGAVPDDELDLSTDEADIPKQEGMKMDHFDEWSIGYERLLGGDLRIGVRGIYRTLQAAWGIGFDEDADEIVLGNIGRGRLSFVPEAKRDYTALEIRAEQTGDRALRWQASYVLSRTYGNYPGLFNNDAGLNAPGNYDGLVLKQQAVNSTGRLPNDRPHVFKLVASYHTPFGLSAGTFFTVQSGTPISALAPDMLFAEEPVHVDARGSAGRTPTIVDLNLRFAYELPRFAFGRARVLIDALNLISDQRTVWVDQLKYLDPDKTVPNDNYRSPVALTPPALFRVGLEVALGGR